MGQGRGTVSDSASPWCSAGCVWGLCVSATPFIPCIGSQILQQFAPGFWFNTAVCTLLEPVSSWRWLLRLQPSFSRRIEQICFFRQLHNGGKWLLIFCSTYFLLALETFFFWNLHYSTTIVNKHLKSLSGNFRASHCCLEFAKEWHCFKIPKTHSFDAEYMNVFQLSPRIYLQDGFESHSDFNKGKFTTYKWTFFFFPVGLFFNLSLKSLGKVSVFMPWKCDLWDKRQRTKC